MSDKTTLFNIEVKFWQEVKVFNWKYSWTFLWNEVSFDKLDMNDESKFLEQLKKWLEEIKEKWSKKNNYLLLLDQILWFKILKYQKEQSFINEMVFHWYFLNKWNKWNGKFLEDCVTDLDWETNNTYCKHIKDENDYSEYTVNFWDELESLLNKINDWVDYDEDDEDRWFDDGEWWYLEDPGRFWTKEDLADLSWALQYLTDWEPERVSYSIENSSIYEECVSLSKKIVDQSTNLKYFSIDCIWPIDIDDGGILYYCIKFENTIWLGDMFICSDEQLKKLKWSIFWTFASHWEQWVKELKHKYWTLTKELISVISEYIDILKYYY